MGRQHGAGWREGRFLSAHLNPPSLLSDGILPTDLVRDEGQVLVRDSQAIFTFSGVRFHFNFYVSRSRNPDLGVYADRSVVGTGSGRIALYPEIIPSQKSAYRKFRVTCALSPYAFRRRFKHSRGKLGGICRQRLKRFPPSLFGL